VILSTIVEELPESRPLLGLLGERPELERFAFVKGEEGAVGWGVAARLNVGTGPGRFIRTRDLLEATVSGTDAVGFASFSFDEGDASSVVVIPKTVIARREGRTLQISVARRGQKAEHPSGPASAARTSSPQPRARARYAGSTVRDDAWLDAVATAVRAIDTSDYAKVVLARDLHMWSRTPFDVPAILEALAERFPSCMTFLVDHLLGASPELLLRRSGAQITSRVLAGTAARAVDAGEDERLGAALLASEKDLWEHDLALRSAVDALSPVCTALEVPDRPSLVRLDNVQHLGSDLTGTLDAAVDSHVLALLERLHPTAAVGGAPRDAALQAIRDLEGMSRGRYAGPVGWFTSDGDGEFAIALRCAEIRGDRARLFAGAGIVAGSLPEAELTETWLKLRAMTGVLGA
jgi:menaquinone-specific isochorismate synthase